MPGMVRDRGRGGEAGAWWGLRQAALLRSLGVPGACGAVRLVEAEVTRFVVSGGAPSRICTPGQERQGMVVRVADWL